ETRHAYPISIKQLPPDTKPMPRFVELFYSAGSNAAEMGMTLSALASGGRQPPDSVLSWKNQGADAPRSPGCRENEKASERIEARSDGPPMARGRASSARKA